MNLGSSRLSLPQKVKKVNRKSPTASPSCRISQPLHILCLLSSMYSGSKNRSYTSTQDNNRVDDVNKNE